MCAWLGRHAGTPYCFETEQQAPTGAVRALVMANDGQLFPALEALLRAQPTYKHVTVVACVLYEVLSRNTLVLQATHDNIMCGALMKLVLTYGKVLRYKAKEESWTDEMCPPQPPQGTTELSTNIAQCTGYSQVIAACIAAAVSCSNTPRTFSYITRVHSAAEGTDGQQQSPHACCHPPPSGGGSDGAGADTTHVIGSGSQISPGPAQPSASGTEMSDIMRRRVDLFLAVVLCMGAPAALLLDKALLAGGKAAADECAQASLFMHDALAAMCGSPALHSMLKDAIHSSGGTVPAPLMCRNFTSTGAVEALEVSNCPIVAACDSCMQVVCDVVHAPSG